MAALVYPSTLPGPSVATVQSDERRLVSELDGARVTGLPQRDRLATQQLVFNFVTFAQCAAFDAWWRDTLIYGAAWFSATWPLPQGLVSAVRRFIAAPRWDYIASIGWRVSVLSEVRGRGLGQNKSLSPEMLLHFNGSFADVGSGARTFSGTAAAQISTAAPKFGSGALEILSYAASGYLLAPGNITLGGTDVQLEGWAKIATTQANNILMQITSAASAGLSGGNSGDARQLEVSVNAASDLVVTYGNTGMAQGAGTLTQFVNGVWTHWALVDDATGLRAYVNGVMVREAAGAHLPSGPYTNQSIGISTGLVGPATYWHFFTGQQDELRLIREVSYTGSSITVPTAAFSP